MSVTFSTRVISVQVKAKAITEYDRETKQRLTETIQVGRLTLEFDDAYVVQQLAELIGDRPVLIGLANTQLALRQALDDGDSAPV